MKKIGVGLIVTSLLAVTACKSSPKTAAQKEAQDAAAWPHEMQSMAQEVKKLVPFLYDRDAYHNPANRAEIAHDLKEFAAVADKIKPHTGKKFIGDNLLLEYSIANLKDDLNRATYSFETGQLEYSRSVAKASLSHCFRCHSITQTGASAAWDIDQLRRLNLAPLEKADLLVATRKYDKALSYMESLLNSAEFQQKYAFDFETLLRRYLALTIRVKADPKRGLAELDKVLEHADIPHYIVEQADGWRESLKAWAKEKGHKVRTAKELFAQVNQRFEKAYRIQHYEKDHAGDVEYLRATSLLHDGLKLLKTPQDEAHALYLLGRAYEVLDELGSWNLHESYYEACILKDPKSAMAKKCYNRLEASLYLGYSGSAGTHLPPEEQERLKRLKETMH